MQPHDHDLADRDASGMTRQEILRSTMIGAAALALPGVLGSVGAEAASAATGSLVARTGGRIKLAMADGGPQETLNPFLPNLSSETQRSNLLFEPLFYRDGKANIASRLAVSAEPGKDASTWKVTLRKGVTFHDGKPLTADDVIYTYRQLLNPKTKAVQASSNNLIDPKLIRKDGNGAVIFKLKAPVGDFPAYIGGGIPVWIIRAGTTQWTTANGTGPYKLVRFKAGQPTELARYGGYWGKAYIDRISLVTIPDPVQRMNALIAGTVDGAFDVHYAQAEEQRSNKKIQLLSTAASASWVGMTFQVDVPPFNDKNVRTALKLSIDRKQTIQNALRGFGVVGNDVPGKGFPSYNNELPQRQYDPEKAKSLLKKAGQEDLSFTLYTSEVSAGMLESATVWKQQAKAAGISIDVQKLPADSYWTDKYLKVPAYQTNWGGPFETVVPIVMMSSSEWNETHWKRPAWDKAFNRAIAMTDSARRNAALKELQEPLWDEGGYIVWGFGRDVKAVSKRIRGTTVPVSGVYFDPRTWWLP